MSKIFISYRREDSISHAGRLYDHLIGRFGETKIFMDIDNMRAGLDFVEQIENAVQACDVLIAVIGKGWMTMKNEEGIRRLDNPLDFVRLEIQAALDRNIPVVPLLVGGAGMPKASELPDALAKLARRHAMKMSDERFRADATRLIDQISEYVTEEATKGPPTSATKKKSASTPKSKPTSTPKGKPAIPDGMVFIPKGPFLYGGKKKKISMDHDYYMDVYPVTNAAYAKFIKAGGYGNESYWTKEGWQWRKKGNTKQPKFWATKKWTEPRCPVAGVNYYEAEAYASWAGKRLPTEQEWEKAARGTDGRNYPWGKKFDANRCALFSGKISDQRTEPVGSYLDGKSPYGCHDMAGNVWEWCASWEDDDQVYRVKRGGSWGNDDPECFRCADRTGASPEHRDSINGFRCAQDIP